MVGLISKGIDKLVDRKVGSQQFGPSAWSSSSSAPYRPPLPYHSPHPSLPSPYHSAPSPLPYPATVNGGATNIEIPDEELPKPETGIKVSESTKKEFRYRRYLPVPVQFVEENDDSPLILWGV